MQLTRTELLLGTDKVIIGNKYSDLILETLGKVYVKSGNKIELLDAIIKLVLKGGTSSLIIIVNNISELELKEYPGDGVFIFNKDTNSLYISLDLRYILLIEAQVEENPLYVLKKGDTMTGTLEIVTQTAPLIVASSDLVKNFNALFLEGYSSLDFAKRKLDEYIYGNWTFGGKCTSENNWVFKNNIRCFGDIVTNRDLTSPEFAGGFSGYGWRLDSTTNTLTIDYLVVRKAMLVYEMVINQISATNGSLWVSNSAKCEKSLKINIIKKSELESNFSELNLLSSLFNNDLYYLITDDNLDAMSVNYDTNTLGVLEETNIGIVNESSSLSNPNTTNTETKSFLNYSYIIYVIDGYKFAESLKSVSDLYSYDTLSTNEYATPYYISKLQKLGVFDSSFNKDILYPIIPRDSSEIVFIKPYYKYFALSKSIMLDALDNGLQVPYIFIVDTDSNENPTLKPGDIVRCQKYMDGSIKYYDAIVLSLIDYNRYIMLQSPSVFDIYTETHYDDEGNLISSTTEYNNNLYNKTEKYFNYYEGEEVNETENETSRLTDITQGDDIVLVGNIFDRNRLNAIYITSTDDSGPFIDVMAGINRPDFSVIYDTPKYKLIKAFIKKKGDIYVKGEPDSYYYQTVNPICINYLNKSYKQDISNKYPLVFLLTHSLEDESELPTYKVLVNEEVTQEILDTPEKYGYFLTEYITEYSIRDKESNSVSKLTKTRLGNLSGIYNEIFKTKQPYGYGLYSENVFLTGEFYLNNGKSIVEFTEELIKLEIAGSISKNYILNSKGPFEVKSTTQDNPEDPEHPIVIEFSKLFLLKKFILIGADMHIHWLENYTGEEETPPHVRAFLRFKDSESPNLEVFNDTVFKPTNEFDAIIFKGNNFEGTIEKLMLSLGSTKYDWEPAELDAIGSSFEMTENGITLVGKEILLKGQIKFEYLDGLTLDNLNYLTKNLKDATKESTLILGGLILTNTIALGESSSVINEETQEEEKVFNIFSGISGNYDAKLTGGGISYWAGGDAFDKESMPPELYPEGIRPAKSLLRMDGTGYLADGSITWDKDGNLRVNPLTFWININNGEYKTLEELLNQLVNLFSPIYETSDDPESPIIGIYAKHPMAVLGEVTTYSGIPLSLPSIFDGLPIDWDTIYWELDEFGNKAVLKAKTGSGGGGVADFVEWKNVNNKPTWITDTNPSYTKSESDNKYITALGTSGNNLTYTKNGTTTPITVPYATNAGTLSGKSLHLSGQNPYGKIPFISGIDGGMEIGKFLDFHTSSDDNRDYAIRLQATNTTGGATITLPSKAGTLALLTDNVTSASKLETARKLWGQSFDGTKDISGNMSGVGNIQLNSSTNTIITPFTSDLTSSEAWYGLTFKWDNSNLKVCLNGYAGISFKTSGSGSHVMSSNGNVGIGTTSPSEKLSINGGILSIQNYSNKVSIGSQNSSFCHIYSSLPFAMNNSLYSTSSGDIGNSTYPWNNLFIRGSVSSIKNNSATFGATQMLDYVNSVFSVNVNSYVNKNTCRNILSWCDVINSVGYITRYAIGSIRENSGFGQLYLAVGNNDNGTSLGCALRLDGNAKKVIIKGDLVIQGNVLSEGGVTTYASSGESDTAVDLFSSTRFNVVGTNNSDAYISADSTSNMFFNWGGKTGLVLSGTSIRSGNAYPNQFDLGSSQTPFKDLYLKGLTVASSIILSDTNMVGIRTDINNPFIGFRHNSQNWYVQGYNGQLQLGPGSTKSVKIDVNGNMSVYGKVTESSDIRLKTDIKPLENRGYVEPKTFVKDGESCIGFIAQDVKELYPELVTEDSESYLSLSYSQYVAVLQAQIIELNERIKKIERLVL